MRKWLYCLVLMLAFSSLSYAEEQILDVSVYKQGLVLNGVNMNSSSLQHPLLFFKEIVYMPISTEMGIQAGFSTKWDEASKTLSIEKAEPMTRALPTGVYAHPDKAQVRTAGTPVNFADQALITNEYPILVYQDVTYLPLTWDMVNTKFGWKSAHHPFMGLVIQSDPKTLIEDVLKTFNVKYYEALADFIISRNGGYSKPSALETVRMIKENADRYSIDEKWIMAVWWKESTFNTSSVSSHGAVGAMQIMPATGVRLGYTREQLLIPKYNVEGGTRYLAGLRDTFNGDMFKAVSAYNQGSGAVSRGSFSRGFGTDVVKKFETISSYVQSHLGQ